MLPGQPMKVPVPALGLVTSGLTVDVPCLSVASCSVQNSADPGIETPLYPQHIGYQRPIDFVELQSPADEPKTQLLQLSELQKPRVLIEPAG